MMTTVGKSIRRWRIKRGMTQQELADRTGMKQSTISRLEAARNPHAPGIDTLQRVAKALRVKLVVRLEQ